VPLLMAGFDRQHLPTRTLREAARRAEGPLAERVSTGTVRAWDLFELTASALPGAAQWAEKTLDAIVASAVERYRDKVDCPDCVDLGFYGLTSAEDPDLLTGLLRREGDGGYEQLVAGAWTPYTPVWDQRLEILDEELAGDLAEALTAGASGLMRRFYWPKAFLPPQTLTVTQEAVQAFTAAAAPTQGADGASAPKDNPAQDAKNVEKAQGESKVTAGPEDGWTEYAVVDDLDPGAVLNLIRLAPGPELADYEQGKWVENPDLLSKLQGVNPPPLVELDQDQLTSVMGQIDQGPVATTAAAPGVLVAGDKAPLTVSPDPRAEKLRRYWTTGKGGIKVRWGTPGDWKRCYRHLSKFMGTRAKGYCQNLHKRATGIWTGNKLNPGGNGHHGGRTAAGAPALLSLEAALVASMSTGSWLGPDGSGDKGMTLKDGVYAEAGENVTLLRTLTAGGFPVNPPDEWFANPQLDGPTPLTIEDDGRVYGHIATFDVAHIGLPGRVHAPKSRSDYAYFKTGQLVTASGAKINVGQLTLSGGHAPLNADASAAVAHYDNTASSVCDLNIGEDRYGIWVAGATRPEVTPQQLRTLRASAPSGDWRPINGHLELVACCQVNVPGFPVARARVASGAITALVAAGARPLAARKLALLADAELAARIAELENFVYGQNQESLVGEPDMNVVAADGAPGEGVPAVVSPELEAEVEDALTLEPQAEGEQAVDTEETPAEPQVSDAVRRAREAVAARKADLETRRAALRERVHGRVPVAADGAPPFTKKKDGPAAPADATDATVVDPDGDGDDDSIPGGPADTDDDAGFSANPDDYAAPLPGLSDEAIHGMLAQKQGISDLSHGDAVQALHGDYQGDAKKMAADLANGKVKKPKKAAPKAAPAAPAAPAVPAGLGNV